MSANASAEDVAGARAYEALHVPALFRQWAAPVLDAAAVGSGQQLLDVACGTGVVAREALRRVGDNGRVAGVDANAGMLAVAAELAPGVDFRHGVADALPFHDDTFDAVVCQFGLMFFPDRAAAIREMLRVLKPDGRFAVAVWESLDRSEAYPEEVALLERLAGTAAADALRAPFVLGDVPDLESLFAAAGATSSEVRTLDGTARFPSVRSMVEADLRGWLPVMGVQLEEELIGRILSEAESALGAYVTDDGEAVFRAPAHIVSGGAG